MSSWSDNMMEVTASEADILKLKAFFKNGFCLDAIKPMPPEIANGSGRYDWAHENWGTTWVGTYISNSPDEVVVNDPFEPKMSFLSNYLPPVEALEELTRQFTEISIKLRWYSREFSEAGEIHISKGASVRSYTGEEEEVRKIAKEIHGDDWFDDEE
jgi:hypothetical protein